MRVRIAKTLAILALAGCVPPALRAASPQEARKSQAPAFINVELGAPVQFPHLKTGDTLQGTVTEDVFSGYRLLVPEGSKIDLPVSGIKRGRKVPSSILPWPILYLRPKYEKLPTFDFADVTLKNGERVRLHVVDVFKIERTAVPAQAAAKASAGSGAAAGLASRLSKPTEPVVHAADRDIELVVSAIDRGAPVPSARSRADVAAQSAPPSGFETISAGSNAKLALLGKVSASKSRAGDPFEALLVQPMRLNSGELLPEGTVFEGSVTRSRPPRWLGRSGSLYVRFTRLMLPAEGSVPIAASVAGVAVTQESRIQVNSEGGMSGGPAGRKRLLLELGVTAGISKVADDTYQLIAEALISSATDASTAGTARLIGFAFSGLYMLTRHGRDVVLPRYTPITVRFDRPPSLLPSKKAIAQ